MSQKVATLDEIRAPAADFRKRAPTLQALAAWVNAECSGFRATIDTRWVDTSRQVPGHRFVYAHTGYDAPRLTITDASGREVYEFTRFREFRNYQACNWIVSNLDRLQRGQR